MSSWIPPPPTYAEKDKRNNKPSDFATLIDELEKVNNSDQVRLVVGIDFGTTFSGISYALVHPADDPEDVKIYSVRGWKGRLPGKAVSGKVPTQIAFDKDGKPYWGYDIPHDLERIKFVKLLLEPEASKRVSSLTDVINSEATGAMLEKQNRDPIQIASEYVRLLWEHAREQIIKHISQATFDFASKQIIMTVPAVWSDRAKHNTYMLAINAGLAEDQAQLSMVSEPEAAAIAVLKDRARTGGLNKDDVYIIVDAGGGTVDVTTYKVKQTWPLVFEEAIAGDGDVCGATFLEVNFRRLLRTYLGTTHFEDLDPYNQDFIICDFENSIRAPFTGKDDRPYAIAVPGIPNEASVKIKSGMMHFKAAEILPVFTPVVERVERLVRRQIAAISDKGLSPRAIVLVGGLGSNHYLAQKLRERYEEKIEIHQPDTSWETIANGAVRCEVSKLGSPVSMRVARYSIGFTLFDNYSEGKHHPDQKTWHECHESWYATDAINWVMLRGDEIKSDSSKDAILSSPKFEDEIDKKLKSKDKRFTYKIGFVVSPDEKPPNYPTRQTRTYASATIEWDLVKFPKEKLKVKKTKAGREFRQIDLKYHIKYTSGGIKFSYSLEQQYVGEMINVDFLALPDAIKTGEATKVYGDDNDED